MTVGRLVTLLFFAFVEKEWLSVRTRNLLAGATGLQLLKITARALGVLPDLGKPLDQVLDTVLLLVLAAAVLHLGNMIRHQENKWAKMIAGSGPRDVSDFNNPEHEWNKPDKAANRKQRS